MNPPIIEQILVGQPQTYGQKDAAHPMDREWTSGIVKHPVKGKIRAGKTKLEGDGQGDRKNHGGREKAIFVYPISHYAKWQNKLKRMDFTVGVFGENVAVKNVTEADVCIGDIFRIGEAIMQISQPRRPCWRPARRWKIKDLAIQIQQEGLTGWYFRVLKEGAIQEGDHLHLQERPLPEWTVAKCNDIMYHRKQDLNAAAELAECELLAESWRATLSKRVNGQESDSRKRVIGPNE